MCAEMMVSTCFDKDAGTSGRRKADDTASYRTAAMSSSIDENGVRLAFLGALTARIEILLAARRDKMRGECWK